MPALTGAYFFGSAPIIESLLDRLAERPRHLILDLSAVPLIDPSGARSPVAFARRTGDYGSVVLIVGASQSDEHLLRSASLPGTTFAASV